MNYLMIYKLSQFTDTQVYKLSHSCIEHRLNTSIILYSPPFTFPEFVHLRRLLLKRSLSLLYKNELSRFNNFCE